MYKQPHHQAVGLMGPGKGGGGFLSLLTAQGAQDLRKLRLRPSRKDEGWGGPPVGAASSHPGAPLCCLVLPGLHGSSFLIPLECLTVASFFGDRQHQGIWE